MVYTAQGNEKRTKIEVSEETALALQASKETISETYEDVILRLMNAAKKKG